MIWACEVIALLSVLASGSMYREGDRDAAPLCASLAMLAGLLSIHAFLWGWI